MRDALVSWNHSTDYKLPEFQSIGAGAGIGGFEKVYDTSERPYPSLSDPHICCRNTLLAPVLRILCR